MTSAIPFLQIQLVFYFQELLLLNRQANFHHHELAPNPNYFHHKISIKFVLSSLGQQQNQHHV